MFTGKLFCAGIVGENCFQLLELELWLQSYVIMLEKGSQTRLKKCPGCIQEQSYSTICSFLVDLFFLALPATALILRSGKRNSNYFNDLMGFSLRTFPKFLICPFLFVQCRTLCFQLKTFDHRFARCSSLKGSANNLNWLIRSRFQLRS